MDQIRDWKRLDLMLLSIDHLKQYGGGEGFGIWNVWGLWKKWVVVGGVIGYVCVFAYLSVGCMDQTRNWKRFDLMRLAINHFKQCGGEGGRGGLGLLVV